MTVHGGDGRLIAGRAEFAARFRQRFVGRMGSPALQPGEGLLLRPCNSVHTCFCHGAMDLVFLDRDDQVLAVSGAVPPWRFRGRHGAAAVLELAPGAAASLKPGDRLRFTSE